MPSTPTDSDGRRAGATGYAPGTGVLPAQMGTPTTDASGKTSAPFLFNVTGPGATPTSATVWAAGELRVQEQPTQQFFTGYDTGLETTNVWKTPTASGGGVAATSATANTVLGTGTVASGYSYLESQATFPPESPGWLLVQHAINIEFPVSVNAYRFWGLGTSPGSPTAAAPLTNAIGFEVATTGKMYAVVYASGTRMVVQDLSTGTGNSTQPQDANVYSFNMYFRGDKTYFSIGSLDNIVAQTYGGPGPDVNTLPVKLTAIAGSTPPVSSVLLTSNAATVATTSRNNVQLSDGTYQWRKAVIDVNGAQTTKVSGGPDLILIPSAAFTTTQTTADLINASGRGVRVVLDVTTVGIGSVTLEIDAKDVASGKYVAQLTGVAVVANSTTVYTLYPGLTPVANSVVSDVLPHTWRVKITANNANSVVYSVGASMLT